MDGILLVTHSIQADQCLSEQLAIINAPLPDESGHDLAAECTQADMNAILLVKVEISAEVMDQVSYHHVLVLPKPLATEAFHQALYLLSIARQRLALLQAENQRLHHHMEEMRWVERAKLLLIEKKSLSEAYAHRYIEKEAMDLRRPKVWVVQRIIQLLKE